MRPHYGCLRNVVTRVEFECRANPAGTTGGKLLCPSDGREPKTPRFHLTPGSARRGRRVLPYWSGYRAAGTKQPTQYTAATPAGDAAVLYSGVP
jgi:quinone-modifying oxidoreductase subunit QmoA